MKPKNTATFSPFRLVKSLGFAFQGLFYLVKNEKNFQVHLVALTVVSSAGFYFHLSKNEWCIVVLCCMLVLMGEAFNSALEKLSDYVAPQHEALIKIAKDVAAAGVLLAALGAVIIAVLIFGGKILGL